MQKWPFFNKPKIQQVQPEVKQEPAQQQKPNQQAMPDMSMSFPTVPAPMDNSMYLSPIKKLKMSHDYHNILSMYKDKTNIMGQQHMENNNLIWEQMNNSNIMGQQYMNNIDSMPDQSDIQVSMAEALNLIKEAVEGEREDRMFYEFLIDNAPNNKDREVISGIRDDEIKHAKMFRKLYYELTGKVLNPKQEVNFEKPANYCEGLIKALMGEQNAVRKYRRILFAMKDRSHINTLSEIITDEIRHASLYNLLIHNNDCKYK